MKPEAKFSQEFREALEPYKKDVFYFRIETSHTQAGVPDWCLCFRGGKVVFIELKVNAPLTPAQKIVQAKFDDLKIPHLLLRKKNNSVSILNSRPEPLAEVVKVIMETYG